MDRLIPALLAALDGDSELTSTLEAEVWFNRQPDDPTTMLVPRVVMSIMGSPEPGERLGGPIDLMPEVHIWGYEGAVRAEIDKCFLVAQRVDELMLTPRGTTVTGPTASTIVLTGWQTIAGQDPRVIHLVNRYSIRFWSAGRIAAIT